MAWWTASSLQWAVRPWTLQGTPNYFSHCCTLPKIGSRPVGAPSFIWRQFRELIWINMKRRIWTEPPGYKRSSVLPFPIFCLLFQWCSYCRWAAWCLAASTRFSTCPTRQWKTFPRFWICIFTTLPLARPPTSVFPQRSAFSARW